MFSIGRDNRARRPGALTWKRPLTPTPFAWDGEKWEPREARPEKRNPNPLHFVEWLKAFHAAPWRPLNLLPFLSGRHYRQQERLNSPEHTWLWGDASTGSNPLTNAHYPELASSSFDVILAIHSIHHGMTRDDSWAAWVANLSTMAAPGAHLVIATIDPARLPRGNTSLPDSSFVRRLAEPVNPATFRNSFAWAGSAIAPTTESYYELSRINANLAAAGWELATLRRANFATENWAPWSNAHVWLVYRKLA